MSGALRKERKCPTCKALVPADAQYWPFCCEKCKLIDLGNWALERYRVPAEEIDLDATKGEDVNE